MSEEQYNVEEFEAKCYIQRLKCLKCNVGTMNKTGVVLTTTPPQYQHKCDKCDNQVLIVNQSFPAIAYNEVKNEKV